MSRLEREEAIGIIVDFVAKQDQILFPRSWRLRRCRRLLAAVQGDEFMNQVSEGVIDRVRVREVAGVFRSPKGLGAATRALLLAGFDRADIDFMSDYAEVVRKLRTADLPARELAHMPRVPRRALIAPEDVVLVVSCVAGIVAFLSGAASALFVVKYGASYLAAFGTAVVVGAVVGGAAAYLTYKLFGRDPNAEIKTLVAAGGIVLWVRVRSPEREAKALELLSQYGAQAVEPHEIEIEKRLEDVPLSSIRPDPWLGSRLGDIGR